MLVYPTSYKLKILYRRRKLIKNLLICKPAAITVIGECLFLFCFYPLQKKNGLSKVIFYAKKKWFTYNNRPLNLSFSHHTFFFVYTELNTL